MNDRNKNIVYVFSPHPDDESLACGGMIIKRLSEGYEVKVIVMTDGANSHSATFNLFSNPTQKELAEIRRKELKAATAILGIVPENIVFLDAEDGYLSSVENLMVDKVEKLLQNDKGDIAEIFVTHEKDYHKDHIATAAIVRKAIKQFKLSVRVYYYMIYSSLERDDIGNLGTKIEIDISDILPTKVKAINQYKSQIELFSNQQIRPVIQPFFLEKFCTSSIETFWK